MSSILCSVSLAESYVKIAPVQRRLSELDETFLPPEEIEEGPHTTLTVQVQETYLFEEAIVKEVTPEPVVDLEEVRSRMNSEQTKRLISEQRRMRSARCLRKKYDTTWSNSAFFRLCRICGTPLGREYTIVVESQEETMILTGHDSLFLKTEEGGLICLYCHEAEENERLYWKYEHWKKQWRKEAKFPPFEVWKKAMIHDTRHKLRTADGRSSLNQLESALATWKKK